eukprot:446442-Pleurochrysis_carterae.AAC.1
MAHTPVPVSAVKNTKAKSESAPSQRRHSRARAVPQAALFKGDRRTNSRTGSGAPKARATSPMT